LSRRRAHAPISRSSPENAELKDCMAERRRFEPPSHYSSQLIPNVSQSSDYLQLCRELYTEHQGFGLSLEPMGSARGEALNRTPNLRIAGKPRAMCVSMFDGGHNSDEADGIAQLPCRGPSPSHPLEDEREARMSVYDTVGGGISARLLSLPF
jgi:hypothetical protein